nr:PREDICTED: uncharacterized protein LOC106535818 [Austrofundulus limnaeus]
MEWLADEEEEASQFHLDLHHRGEDVLDIGLDVHGLSEDDDEPGPSTEAPAAVGANQEDTSFLSLCCRAAQKLEVDWPAPPPAQKPLRFAGFFLPTEPTAVKNHLPMFPDFVSELTSCWTKPLSTRVTVPGYGPYLDLEGAENAGLVNIPPMEPSLAAYLAPSHNHGVSRPTTLPSKPCRFSASQLEKIHKAQATTARSLSSISMLQTYQAMALVELGVQVPAESLLLPLLNEIRLTADYVLSASRGAALSLGRGMASTVVAQRHLWLTLSDVPDRDRATYLDEPVMVPGLFGQSLDIIQAKFELRKKQAEALLCIIPRRDSRPKTSTQKPAAQLSPAKRTRELAHTHFRIRPPRFNTVVNTVVRNKTAVVLREEINTLLAKGTICVVPSSDINKGWYSRYFVVLKKDGGLHPILDLRVLNKFLRTYRFKMLTLRQLLNSSGPGDWFATIDLTDTYFHVAIHPDHRKFLRFAFEGVAYEYLVLPFGLSLAPCTFSKCVEVALSPLREIGVRLLAYLDDWALIASSKEQATEHLSQVLSHVQALHFSVNFQKSLLTPSQQFSFLGLEIQYVPCRAERISQKTE